MTYRSRWDHACEVDEMMGRTLTSIEGAETGSDEITFTCDDGTRFVMYHEQGCCESVCIEDVIGSPEDLVGEPLRMAEEVSDADGPEPENHDSYTWTFYKFATAKGYVTIRWLGESNGYYSESVDLCKLPPA